ncbi:putative coil containing protein [Vibrio phage 137E35-1]|nr:putative coil containing protein [Vibrio phage 137E35-1]CAH9016128.1 putative coil containing protein [Vibrio phage 230E39-1]
MSQHQFDSIEKSLHFIDQQASEYAKAKSNRVHLEEFRKVKKAVLVRQAKEEGVKTAQERESYAYSHEEYIALLDGLKAAVETEETLRWRLTAARENIDYRKHRGIYEMAQMKLI